MSRYPLDQQLYDAADRARSAAQELEQATRHRDRLVRQALSRGKTHAQIAEATSLSRGRIGQIASASS